jgi:hypothetical protein
VEATSKKGVESPNFRAASLQVQLRLSFLRSLVFGMDVADEVVTVLI